MTRLKITIEARAWNDRAVGRTDQARRSRLAAMLRDMATCIEQGRPAGTVERPDLIGTFTLELPTAEPANRAV